MNLSTTKGSLRAVFGLARWRHEAALRRRLGAVGHLLTGNVANGIVLVAAAALAARALGPADYGLLAMIISYSRAIERLVTFQSWQPLIKYGAELDAPEHRSDLRTLFKFGFALDLAGVLLAWGLAIGLALAGATLFDWSSDVVAIVLVFCTQLLFNINGTPTAILRLAGRFRVIAYIPLIGAVARLACCAVAITLGAGLWAFASIWMACNILGAVALLLFALWELRRQRVGSVLKAPLRGVRTRFPGIWGFAWSTNLSLTIRTSAQELDTILVGALADPASAGLYHLAKRIGRIAQQVGVHVQAVLYPDVARLWFEGAVEKMKRAVWQVELLLAACGIGATLVLLPTAEPLLRLLAGPAFGAAAPLLIVQMVAVTFTMTGFGARAALLAMGRQQRVLLIVTVATGAFHVAALLLIPRMGAMGANVAHIVLGSIWCVWLTIEFRRAVGRQESSVAAPGEKGR